MIFVTVGTNEAPFDRLLEAVEALPESEEVVVQRGSSHVEPRRAHCIEYLPFDELVSAMRRARVVVTHAGVGSVMAALTNGKRAVVMPRLARYGEAVDDHQLELAHQLEGAGLVIAVEDAEALAGAVAQDGEAAMLALPVETPLVAELRTYLRAEAGRTRR